MQNNTFVNEIVIRAKISEVATALANPEASEKYYFGFRVNIDGQKITYTVGDHTMIEGEILEFIPNKIIKTTFKGLWNPEVAKDEPTTVTWDLEEQDNGENTFVKMTHSDLVPESYSDTVLRRGWVNILSSLKSYLETGKALNIDTSKM
jgi:uncharacterized protein YndB with AHSA1/START domain